MFLEFSILYCRNFTYACHTFPLNTMFLQTLLCESVDLPVENCEYSKVPLTGSKVPPGLAAFNKIRA